MKHLYHLLGQDWIEKEVLCTDPRHPLGLWYKKSRDNPVSGYADQLIDFILNNGAVKCDAARLASKLKAEFAETLTEMDYAVFLGKQRFQVTMEPAAPKAGPDLLATRGHDYYLEVRKVGLDEARAAADLATDDVFARLCNTPSRYSVLISMTEEYSAYSPRLKQALRLVRSVLKDLSERRVQKASLYYHGPADYTLREDDEVEPDYDYSDARRLSTQVAELERARNARFVARFDDSGEERARTTVGVHPLGPDPHFLKPDETYLRLRGIIRKKREQLPKASRGLIVLELSDLQKIAVDQETLLSALYGDLQMRVQVAPAGRGFQSDFSRKANGVFLGTSRVSAVVVERTEITERDLSVSREVFPTNNPQAVVLALEELRSFGVVAAGLEHLCAEQLGK